MKILFHINSLGRGGAEHVVSILADNFAAQGNDVVIATQWQAEDEYPVGEKVRRIPVGMTEADAGKNRMQIALLRLKRLRDCIRKEQPDIVISFCNKANFRSAFSLIGSRTPLLVSVRNNPVEDYQPHKFATRLMEMRADGCVFQTPQAKAFFHKRLQNKSRIIFNPLSEQFVNAERYTGERGKEIVTVGRISAQKNQMLLLKAFAAIEKDFPDYVLKLYGDVQEKKVEEALHLFVEEKGLQNKVLFMGNSKTIQKDIRKAALFVLPSDYEGMPNALIEAMALGLPCISTDCPCGGSALLIENGVSGLLTKVGDEAGLEAAMREMLANPEKAAKMGLEAGKVTERVNPDRICRDWMDFIEEVIYGKTRT